MRRALAVRFAGLALAVATASAAGGLPAHARETRGGRVMAYAINATSDTVLPLDTATGRAGRPIRVGRDPDAIAITPDGKTVYVASLTGDTVTPVRTRTGKAGRPVKVGFEPDAIAITPDGKTAYVLNSSQSVTPVSTATDTPGPAIRVTHKKNDGPVDIAITPDSKTAYILREFGGVLPIRTVTQTPGQLISTGPAGNGLGITPDGKTLYVLGNTTVIPVRTATGAVGKPIRAGPSPDFIAFTPDGTTAYVADSFSNTVIPIRTATGTPGKPIRLGRSRNDPPGFLAMTPDGRFAFAVTLTAVYRITTATGKAGPPIRFGFSPEAIAITPGGTTAWVTGVRWPAIHGRPALGFAAPIRVATGTAGKAIRLGNDPDCLVMTPWRTRHVTGPASCDG
jgi:DNA-binding beta-propeller fold protein YncE